VEVGEGSTPGTGLAPSRARTRPATRPGGPEGLRAMRGRPPSAARPAPRPAAEVAAWASACSARSATLKRTAGPEWVEWLPKRPYSVAAWACAGDGAKAGK